MRPTREPWQVPNDEGGVAALVEHLAPLAPTLVVPEATGRLDRLAAAVLDAALLARFGQAVRPPPRPLLVAAQRALAALLAHRRQVVAMLTAERQRLGTARGPVHRRIAAHVAWLDRELAELDDDLGHTLRASPVWREREDLLRIVPGIGRSWR